MDDEPNHIETIRYERLKKVCRKALESSITKSLSTEQFKSCYPTIAGTQEGSQALEIARSQVINFWYDNSLKEFDSIFKERNVEVRLNELDEIIQRAQSRRQANSEPPTAVDLLKPAELIGANILTGNQETLESLTMIYNQLCLDNEELINDLTHLRDESTQMSSDIALSLDSINKEVEVLNAQNSKINFKETFEKFIKFNE